MRKFLSIGMLSVILGCSGTTSFVGSGPISVTTKPVTAEKPWAELCLAPEDERESYKTYRVILSKKDGTKQNALLETGNYNCILHIDNRLHLHAICDTAIVFEITSVDLRPVTLQEDTLGRSPYSLVADKMMFDALRYTCPKNIEPEQWEKDLAKVLGPYNLYE